MAELEAVGVGGGNVREPALTERHGAKTELRSNHSHAEPV